MLSKRLIGLCAAVITAVAVVPAANASASDAPPPIKPVGLFEAKWVLPPDGTGSGGYTYLYSYDTVAHDDFTYPPQRP